MKKDEAKQESKDFQKYSFVSEFDFVVAVFEKKHSNLDYYCYSLEEKNCVVLNEVVAAVVDDIDSKCLWTNRNFRSLGG